MIAPVLRTYLCRLRNRLREYRSDSSLWRDDLIIIGVAGLTMSLIYVAALFVLDAERLNKLTEESKYFKNVFPVELLREVVPFKMLQLISYGAFILLVLSSTVSALANLYASQSIDLLQRAPQPSLTIYCTKLAEVVCQTGFILLVLSAPVFAAYGTVFELPPHFYLTLAIIGLPLLVIPAGLGIVLATIFVQFSALFWKRGLLLLWLLLGALAWGAIEALSSIESAAGDGGALILILELLTPGYNPSPLWLPPRWFADVAGMYIGENATDTTRAFLLLLTSAVGSAALGFLAYDTFYLVARSRAESQHQHRRTERDIMRRFIEALVALLRLPGFSRALALKDLTSLVRDRGQSLQLLVYLGLVISYISIFKLLTKLLVFFEEANQAWWAFLSTLNTIIAGFFLVAIVTRIVYPSISLEGRAFWLLLVAPADREMVIRAKFRYWAPLSILISIAILGTGLIAITLDWALLITTVLIGIGLGAGCAGVATGLGARFARFDWEAASQLVAGPGSLVLLCLNFGMVLLTALPAAVMLFLAAVPNIRAYLGPTITIAVYGGAAFALYLMHFSAASWALSYGTAALVRREAA